MTKKLIFNVSGNPFGKQRIRVARGIIYTPKETKDYEKLIKQEFLKAYPNFKPLDIPLKITIEAFYPIPKSTTKKDRELMAFNKLRPTKKPDSDNIEKIIFDGLNGVAYTDDALIVDNRTHKYYSENPRVLVFIEPAPLGLE